MQRLAINGGRPVRTRPWGNNITTGETEKKAALKVLKSGYLSLFEGADKPEPPFSFWGGPYVQKLESMWAAYYCLKHAISMNSATSCLYAAIGALGIGYGDGVIVSPFTMSACAIAPLIYGAIPIFADVELQTGCLSVDSIIEHITERTKAIIVVHQFGFPADMQAIVDIAKKYKLYVIEDCAQAHGAKQNGKYVGTFGDIGIFSLNVNKTIQVGEGGICVTNNKELAYRLALIRNHGEAVVKNAAYKDTVNIIGFNYRMTELQASIAIEQLKKLKRFNKIRVEFAQYLNSHLQKYDCLLPFKGREGSYSTYYVYPLRYLSEKMGIKRKQMVNMINAEGVRFYEGYTCPLYLQPLYQKKKAFKHGYPWSARENSNIRTNYYKGACPNAERLHFDEIILNEHVRLPHSLKDMGDIVRSVQKVLRIKR